MNIETIARAIDPGAWAEDLPTPTRSATEAFHARRQRSNEQAKSVMALLEQQEPVAWMLGGTTYFDVVSPDERLRTASKHDIPLYTTPSATSVQKEN